MYYNNNHDKSQLQFVYDYESSQCFLLHHEISKKISYVNEVYGF